MYCINVNRCDLSPSVCLQASHGELRKAFTEKEKKKSMASQQPILGE
jgi:hypothetical protein